jgi:hypothetical protein
MFGSMIHTLRDAHTCCCAHAPMPPVVSKVLRSTSLSVRLS